MIGPELRTDRHQQRRRASLSRDQRRWIYVSAKSNNYFGLGSDNDMEKLGGSPILKHAALPVVVRHDSPEYPLPRPRSWEPTATR